MHIETNFNYFFRVLEHTRDFFQYPWGLRNPKTLLIYCITYNKRLAVWTKGPH